MTQDAAGSPALVPFLRYDDAPAAIAWLQRAFGFQEQMVVPGPDGTIAHAQLRFGNGVLMLGSTRDDALRVRSPRALGAVTGGIYVHLQDVEDHYRQARSAGAEIVHELAETEYGSREYTARDPEGHLWSFGTYAP